MCYIPKKQKKYNKMWQVVMVRIDKKVFDCMILYKSILGTFNLFT